MKLLFCAECQDMLRLKEAQPRSCRCGNVSGVYTNNLDAKFRSDNDNYFLFGFANSSLQSAIRQYSRNGKPEDGMGIRFDAFIIPEPCPTFVRVDKEEFERICGDSTLQKLERLL